jgi:hypothetical protein
VEERNTSALYLNLNWDDNNFSLVEVGKLKVKAIPLHAVKAYGALEL